MKRLMISAMASRKRENRTDLRLTGGSYGPGDTAQALKCGQTTLIPCFMKRFLAYPAVI